MENIFNFNYEVEFEEKMLELISNNYKTNKPQIYMIMRYMVINNISKVKKIDKFDFISFLLKENDIPKDITYKNTKISLYRNTSQSIFNIIDNWFFDLEKNSYNESTMNNVSFIENNLTIIIQKANKITLKSKKTNYYLDFLLLTKLNLLNDFFEAELNKYNIIENLEYPKDFNFKESYLEEDLFERIEKLKDIKKNQIVLISERDLENYLKRHLYKIEDGLTYIATQYPIKNAFIDIIAKDKNDNIVIIELKVEQDERILWQAIYYPMQYLEENRGKSVRMITLCPNYEAWLLKPLRTIKDVEIMKYELEIEDKKITNIIINKV